MGIFAKWRAKRVHTKKSRVVTPFRRTTRWVVFPFLAVVLIILGIRYIFPQSSAEAAWFNNSWLYRKAIVINNTGAALTDYQIQLQQVDVDGLYSAGKLQADCDDLRFTDATGKVLHHWVEDEGAATDASNCDGSWGDVNIWVKAPSIPSGGAAIYMYYGNASASSLEDPHAVFEVFDDFSAASLDTSTWTQVNGGTPSFSNGVLSITASGVNPGKLLMTAASQSDYYAIRSRFQATGGSNADERIGVGVKTNGSGLGYNYVIRDFTNLDQFVFLDDLVAWGTVTDTTWTKNNWYTMDIYHTGTTVTARWNDGSWNTQAWSGRTGDLALNVGSNDGQSDWDYAAVYKTTATLPTIPAYGSYEAEELSPGPVASWSFDEGYGTTAYDGVGTNHGTLTNSPTWQTEDQCISGKCLYFDGSNDYVLANNIAELEGTNNYTLAAWVKTTRSDRQGIISNHDVSDDIIALTVNDSTGSSAGVASTVTYEGGYQSVSTSNRIDDGLWHYIVVTKQGTASYVYVDAQLKGYGTISEVLTDNPELRIGSRENNSYPFHGFIDEVKIYPYARTAAQVRADYNARGGSSGSTAQVGSSNLGQTLSDGLVAYWKMDDPGADAEGETSSDSSGSSATATLYGDNSTGDNGTGLDCTATGKYNTGCLLDGIDDYLTVPDAIAPVFGSFTWSAWIKTNSTSNNLPIFTKGTGNDSYAMNLSFGFLNINLRDSSNLGPNNFNATTNLRDNEWHHVVATYDQTTGKTHLYTDGEFQIEESNITSGVFGDGTEPLYIGRDNAGTNFWEDDLDEVRIYNRALSPAEVKALYEWAPGPVAHWKLDDNTSTSAVDSSGNQLTASFTNNPEWIQGKLGAALQFSGANYATVADTAELDVRNDITIALWVRPSLLNSTAQLIMGKGIFSANANRQYGIRLNSTNRWQGFLYSGSSVYSVEATGFTPSAGRWDHVTLVREQATGLLKIYINGLLLNTTGGATGDLNDTSYAFAIGREGESTGNYFSGSVDDVQIYNYALTQKQIVNVMNGRDVNTPAVGSPVGHPALHMSFDEGYGTTAFDKSQYGNNGTLTNMASPATATSGWTNLGKFRKALVFDGSNDYVQLSSAPLQNSSTHYSVSAWFKTDSPGSDSIIFSERSSSNENSILAQLYTTGNKIAFITRNDSGGNSALAISTTTLQSDTWYHVVGVRSGNTVYIYLDGMREGFDNDAGGTITSNTYEIGRYTAAGSSSGYWDGLIDELKIYNYALSEDEVLLDYNQSQVAALGALSTSSDGSTPSNASSREYCVPGDTTSCSAPVAEWKMDENTGTTAQDTSGNANTGTLTSSPNWATGKFSSAVHFNGTSQYITAAHSSSLTPTGDYTIGAWVKTSSSNSEQEVVSKFDASGSFPGYLLSVGNAIGGNTGKVCLWVGDSSSGWVCGSTLVNDGAWHYILAQLSGTTVHIYVDGVLDASATRSPSRSNTQALRIGSRYDTGSFPNAWFAGLIDQVRIYNYARTPAQIAWEYNRGAPVAHYKFDECQGSTAYNSALNADGEAAGNDGTITIGGSGTNTSIGTCAGSTGQAWADGATGKLSSSLELDGTDDYVTVSDTDRLTFSTGTSDRPFTISAWVNFDTASGTQGIVSKASAFNVGEFHLTLGTAGTTNFYFRTVDNSIGSYIGKKAEYDLVVNTWYHVITTYDGSGTENGIKIYIDGSVVPVSSSSSGSYTAMENTSEPLYIGRRNSSPTFSGQIDDVRIYNYALTPTQVKTLYNNGAVSFR